jgi:hypothetical protein
VAVEPPSAVVWWAIEPARRPVRKLEHGSFRDGVQPTFFTLRACGFPAIDQGQACRALRWGVTRRGVIGRHPMLPARTDESPLGDLRGAHLRQLKAQAPERHGTKPGETGFREHSQPCALDKAALLAAPGAQRRPGDGGAAQVRFLFKPSSEAGEFSFGLYLIGLLGGARPRRYSLLPLPGVSASLHLRSSRQQTEDRQGIGGHMRLPQLVENNEKHLDSGGVARRRGSP